VTGEPLCYSNWASDQPNNNGNEDRIHFIALTPNGRTRFWNDDLGGANFAGYVVERVPDDLSPSIFLRGDVDQDGGRNLTDGVFALNYLFLNGPEPHCLDTADMDDDGRIVLTDAVSLFNYLFLNGQRPQPPVLACGADPTEDCLSCVSFACPQ
jgi:hypothetical protein